MNSSGVIWMKESYDHIVRDGEDLVRIQDYIRSNPQRARLDQGQFIVSEAGYALDLGHFRDC